MAGNDLADKWWENRVAELKQEYGTDDVWDIPRSVWHEAQAEHSRRLRIEHGRDPDTAEKTPERKKAERAPIIDNRMEAPKKKALDLSAPMAGELDVNQDLTTRAMKGLLLPGAKEGE